MNLFLDNLLAVHPIRDLSDTAREVTLSGQPLASEPADPVEIPLSSTTLISEGPRIQGIDFITHRSSSPIRTFQVIQVPPPNESVSRIQYVLKGRPILHSRAVESFIPVGSSKEGDETIVEV